MRQLLTNLLVYVFLTTSISIGHAQQQKAESSIPVLHRTEKDTTKSQLVVECKFITAPEDMLDTCRKEIVERLKPKGRLTTILPKKFTLDSIPAGQPMKVSTSLAAHWAKLSNREADAIKRYLQKDANSNITNTPTCTCFSGQSIVLKDVVNQKFIVDVNPVIGESGIKTYVPVIESIDEGSKLKILCREKNGKISCDIAMMMSSIKGVDTKAWVGHVQTKNHHEGVSIQQPQVENQAFRLTAECESGNWILVDPGFEKKSFIMKETGVGLVKKKGLKEVNSRCFYLIRVSKVKEGTGT